VNEVFRGLADSKRRIVLATILEHWTVTLPDLAEVVAEGTNSRNAAEISDETIRDIYMTLYHTDVPLLEEANLIEYHQDDDLVAGTDQTRSTLREARTAVDGILESPSRRSP
jgi:hypothetical protein